MVVEAHAGETQRFSLLQCRNHIRSAYGYDKTYFVKEVAEQGKMLFSYYTMPAFC